jgi:hypothetical protein
MCLFLSIRRTSKLQKKPPALRREHLVLWELNFYLKHCFSFLEGAFFGIPGSRSGFRTLFSHMFYSTAEMSGALVKEGPGSEFFHPGSLIPDPGEKRHRIPDPGEKRHRIPDPGSGSATLPTRKECGNAGADT